MISNYRLFQSHPIQIILKHKLSEKEQMMKTILDTTLSKYYSKIKKYWYAPKTVIIDVSCVPYSHPIITINTRLRHHDIDKVYIPLLILLIHENIHHWLSDQHEQTQEAIKQLKIIYSEECEDFVGRKFPSKDSYWLHIIVNWNTVNICNKIFKPAEINYYYNECRVAYKSLDKYLNNNFDKVRKELEELNMVIPI